MCIALKSYLELRVMTQFCKHTVFFKTVLKEIHVVIDVHVFAWTTN